MSIFIEHDHFGYVAFAPYSSPKQDVEVFISTKLINHRDSHK
jgi:hypothetical protein